MNKQNFRVIFNKIRGMLMVVAEIGTCHVKQTEGAECSSTPAVRASQLQFIRLGVVIAMLFGHVTIAQAQIVGDSKAGIHKPTVIQTANGLPLVQIAKPNVAGLSVNQYLQFNVGTQGAILNNSTGTTSTQLGGYVTGNANLTNGSARTILNEVTSTNRSHLNGYLEVAGQRADVIIANPNGISVSGYGVINGNRGVLTTGVPIVSGDGNGNLSGFRVTGGQIEIGSAGLNGTGLSELDLISRSLVLNGQLLADRLNVITGTNQVNYVDPDNQGIRVIEGDNNQPTLSVDMSALGSMYANKIRLIGTERGVGVATLGALATLAGDLDIDSVGVIRLGGKTTATGHVAVNSDQGIINTGTLTAQTGIDIRSQDRISNVGIVATQGDLNLSGAGINSTGVLGAGIDADNSAILPGNINLIASGVINATGQNLAGSSISMNAAAVSLANAHTTAAGNVTVVAASGDIDQSGGTLQSGGVVNVTASGVVKNNQAILSGSQLNVDAASLNNDHGVVSSSQSMTLKMTRELVNTGGTVQSAGGLSLSAQDIDNSGGQITSLNGDGLTITAGGTLTNTQGGVIGGNGNVTLSTQTLINGSSISSTQNLTVATAQSLINASGTLVAGGAIDATVGATLDTTAGTIAGDTISLNAAEINNQQGLISQTGVGATRVNSAALFNNRDGTLQTNANQMSITAGEFINDGGAIFQSGDDLLSLNLGRMSNLAGVISSNGSVSVTSADLNNSGTLNSQKDFNIQAKSIHNRGTIASGQDMALHVGSLFSNQSGTVQAGTIAIPAKLVISANTLDNSDGILGAGTIDLESDDLINSSGQIIQNNSNGAAIVNASRLLNNSEGFIGVAASNLSLGSQVLLNDSGIIAHVGTGVFDLQTETLSNIDGTLATNGSACVTSASLVNRSGKVSAAGEETVSSATDIDNRDGGYIGGASILVNAPNGLIANQGGTIEGAAAGATVMAQSLQNTNGKIQNLGSGPVGIAVAQNLNNASGSIGGAGDVVMTAGGLANNSGAIVALGALTVSSDGALDNADGSIESLGNAIVASRNAINNQGGKIESLGNSSQLVVTAASIDNANGKIINIGTGATTIRGTTSITNSNSSGASGAGLIGGSGDLIVATSVLNNTQYGHLIAGGDLALNVTNGIDNSAGQLTAMGGLTLNQADATLVNLGGSVSAGNISINAATVENTNGSIANPVASGGGIAITAGTITNSHGAIGSDLDLSLTSNELKGDGQVVAGRDAMIRLQGDYIYTSTNEITANRDLTFSTTGRFTNNGKLAATGNLTLTAAGLVNSLMAEIVSGNPGDLTTGVTSIHVENGALTNWGRLEGNAVDVTSKTLINTGTLIGNVVTVNADTLINDGAAAIVAAVNQGNLWITDTLTNQNGATLYSLGDLNMAANGNRDSNGYLFKQTRTINNLSSEIEADGTLNLAANQVNNVRQNVQTNTVTVSDTTTTMTTPSWFSSLKPNYHDDHLKNANTRVEDAYYLDPDSIISTTPLVTPDGYQIYKVVVNLSATDSAFEWMQGDTGNPLPNGGSRISYGGQSRITPTAGTQTIYVTAIETNQTNPDQVANGDAWSQYNNTTIVNQVSHITYSDQYGSCTTNCVRLQTYGDYADPATIIGGDTLRAMPYVLGAATVEVERLAHQVVTETQLAAGTGAAALITSGGATHLAIGSQFNNDNGQLAAGGDLTINGVPSVDGGNANIINTSTRLTRTYSSTNRSGYGNANYDNAAPEVWLDWANTPITQTIGVAGGTISSNQAVSISGGQIINTSVNSSTRPVGAGAAWLGLGDGITPLGLATNNAVNAGSTNPHLADPVASKPVSSRDGGSGLAPRMVDGVRAGVVNTVLPTNGLYHIEPQASKPYLVETDPRFTQYGNFIASDYLLNLIGINPQSTQKRLGDGFYEQQLVNAQITTLTGRKYLTGYASSEDEYEALMTSGAVYAQQFDLVPGIALTDTQMAALTTNIVWLVSQTVTLPDGSRQSVLVPQVYLAQNTDLTPTGALIAGASVAIHGTDITNDGGAFSGRQQLQLVADHDINNIGGRLSGGDVSLIAGNDILNQSTTTTTLNKFGQGESALTAVGQVGSIGATNNLVMSAGQNLSVLGAHVSAGGDALLTAGETITVGAIAVGTNSVAHSGSFNSSSQTEVVAGSSVAVAGNLTMLSRGDTTVTASNVSSGQDMAVVAGGNLKIQNGLNSSSNEASHHVDHSSDAIGIHQKTVVASNLTAGGNATLLAGAQLASDGGIVMPGADSGAPAKNLTLTASSVTAGNSPGSVDSGVVTMGATGNVEIGVAIIHGEVSQETSSSHHGLLSSSADHSLVSASQDGVIGSSVLGNQVRINAANDIDIKGSVITTADALTLNAGRDVNVVSAAQTGSEHRSSQSSKSSIGFSPGTMVTEDKSGGAQRFDSASVQQIGSILSGGEVNIHSGRDTTVAGSVVVADHDIAVAAGRDLNIVSAEDTYSSTSTANKHESGSIGSFFQPAIGNANSGENGTNNSVTQVGSQVVGLTGNVNLVAGENYRQSASAVQTPQGNIEIFAKGVLISAANNLTDGTNQMIASKTAIGGSVDVPLVHAVQDLISTVHQGEASGSGRMQALAALNTISSMGAIADAYKTMAPANGSGMKVSVSLGHNQSESNQTFTESVAVGSSLAAGGNVSIAASGGGTSSNVTSIGSNIAAGRNVALVADNAINLIASQSADSLGSTNSASGQSIGIGFAMGGSQNGFTLDISANQANGRANGEDIIHNNSHISAGNTVSLQSGGDANLIGAVVAGKTVTADVGGSLNLQSLQDTTNYTSKQTSSGAGVSLCIPPFCYGVSTVRASFAKSAVDGAFQSVTEQTGIRAGDGGFQINVKGNTDLKGAAIASNDQAIADGKNSLSTSTLTTSDLHNTDHYSADSFSASGRVGTKMGDQSTATSDADKRAASEKYNPARPRAGIGVGSESGSQTSVTSSGISGGIVEVRDELGQQALTGQSADQAVAELNRDVSTDRDSGGALSKRWNGAQLNDQVNAQAAITQTTTAEVFDAYNTMFLLKAPVYELVKDENGKQIFDANGAAVTREVSDEETHRLKPSSDGKVHVADNGILNDGDAASKYANQHSDGANPQYLVHTPEASNVVSELLVAAYQNSNKGNLIGLTNAATETQSLMYEYGATGLQLDGHSRGALTIGNALEAIQSDPNSKGILSATTIHFFGPAYNAEKADGILSELQNRKTEDSVKQKDMALAFEAHMADPVARLIGGNPATGGTIPEGSNMFVEAFMALFGKYTVHNCYGQGQKGCQQYWADMKNNTPQLQVVNSNNERNAKGK